MEHIPLPEGVKHFIRAPYNASRDEWYRKEGFAKYPEAHGWAEADINGENGFGNREPKQIQNFFQTWLYFALVQDFFALAHINTTTEDFLKPKDPRSQTRVVDSSKLVTLLAQWQELLRDSNEDLDDVWDKVNGMFKKVKLIVNRFCTPALDDDGLPPDEGNQVPSWPVQDEVSTTIITLVVALEEAALQVCHKAVGADRTPYLTARSVVLQRRLERMWCLADASMLLDEMKVDGHYFLAASPSPGEEYMQEHSACTRRSCRFAFDENFYETKHADYPWHSEGCRTQAPYGGHIGSGNGEKDWEDTVCGIIGREAIPIALWNPRLRNLWSAEYHLKGPKKPDYVAISHVWSDGMGNPAANSLPECQLERIQHLVGQLDWEGRRPLVRDDNTHEVGFWMDTLAVPVHDPGCKKKAINDMRCIYENAAAVLVLDKWVQAIPSTAPILVILSRLYQSNWLRRLWTYQEGFLTKRVYFQFSDCALEVETIGKRHQDYIEESHNDGLYLPFIHALHNRVLFQFSFIKGHGEGYKNNSRSWILFQALGETLSERRTTKAADEAICIGTILGFDLDLLQSIPRDPDAMSAQMRMELLLRRLETFRMGSIFNNYERLGVTGFRWAPKSYLNYRNPDSGYLEDKRTTQIKAVNGKEGLPVEYMGVLLDFPHGKPRSLRGKERAFAVEYSGIYLVVQLRPPTTKIMDTRDEDPNAVILSILPAGVRKSVRCVVGFCRPAEPVGGYYMFEHYSIARAHLQNDAPVSIDLVEGTTIMDLKWLVQ